MDKKLVRIQQNVADIIEAVGEDPSRNGLQDTPSRVAKSLEFLTQGYQMEPEDVCTVFPSDGYDSIVLLKDIEIFSLCEHHLLPFYGKAHVAYIPRDKIIGISKLARIVDIYARRFQIQERIGEQVVQALDRLIQPQGSACIITATHMCMRMRGVEKQNSQMTTSCMSGVFRDNSDNARIELMDLLKI